MEKRGRGRPRLDPEGPTAKYLTVRASDAEREAYKEAAEHAAMPLSEWVRDRLNRAAKRESKRR